MSVVVTEPVTSGVVLFKTSLGDILVELWPREAPKAVRNFVQLCLEGYYDGLPFHRIVPGFIAQTGDDSGTGGGGESIYDEGEFEDEITQRLRFNRRGLLAMANQGRKNSNLSQFFFTLDRADELNNRNTIFGRVAAGDTLFNVLKLNEVELEPGTDRPVYPPTIKSVEVKDNPFEDIVPRITAKERKEQNRAKKEMKIERAKQREQGKRKGTKNKSLLSFGAEPEEPVDESLAKTKFKSAHDVLDDGRLSKTVIDDRGTSATLPPGMEGPAKRRRDDEPSKDDAKRTKAAPPPPAASASSLERAREAKKAEAKSADKVRDEIAKVQNDLKKMSKSKDSDDEDSGKPSKKPKRTGPSLLQLERARYASAATGKKKKVEDSEDLMGLLAGFRSKIASAASTAPEEEEEKAPNAAEALLGIEQDGDSGDEGWLSHSLKFRKDVTLDQHTIDEYAVHDPLTKNSESLAEIKEKADNRRRQYPGEREGGRESGRGDRRGGGGGGGGSRGGFQRNEGRERGGYSDRRGGGAGDRRGDDWGGDKDRPEVRGNSWKQDRVSTTDLA